MSHVEVVISRVSRFFLPTSDDKRKRQKIEDRSASLFVLWHHTYRILGGGTDKSNTDTIWLAHKLRKVVQRRRLDQSRDDIRIRFLLFLSTAVFSSPLFRRQAASYYIPYIPVQQYNISAALPFYNPEDNEIQSVEANGGGDDSVLANAVGAVVSFDI